MSESLQGSDYKDLSEMAMDLESLKPYISSIVTKIRSNFTPEISHINARGQFIKMDVGWGPEKGYWPTPARNITKYNFDLGNNRKIDGLLKEGHVVDADFRTKVSRLYLGLEKREEEDSKGSTIAELIVNINGKHRKTRLLRFITSFFLKDDEVVGSITVLGYLYNKRFPWERTRSETIDQKASIEFLKRIGEVF